jgi:hypothetical protein
VKTIILVAEFHHIRAHCPGPLCAAEVADGRFRGVSFPRRIPWISMHCEKLVVGQLLKKCPPFLESDSTLAFSQKPDVVFTFLSVTHFRINVTLLCDDLCRLVDRKLLSTCSDCTAVGVLTGVSLFIA